MDQYVYAHVDPYSGDVVYVGVGTNSRAYASHNVRSDEHRDWMNKHHNSGVNFVEFIATGLDSGEAFDIEAEMVRDLCPIFNKCHNVEYLKARDIEKYGVALIEDIKSLRLQGLSHKEIGFRTNLGTMTVWRLDKRHD